MSDSIPVLDLAPEIEALRPDLDAAYARVMASGRFILGPEVQAFEQEAADYLGVRHAVGVSSGTDALVIALRAAGVEPGDEVITTPFSFFATAESISNVGAVPVFADVREEDFNIDPEAVEAAVTPKTKALMPVHLYGAPAPMAQLTEIAKRHDLLVIEDVAQAFGATYEGRKAGTLGHAGAFSFFPTKNLGGFGDGGLLTTDDAAVADEARKLRAHGSRKKYQNEQLGYNARLDALQAAFLRAKLPHIDRFNEGRRRVAARYNALLKDVDGVIPPALVEGHVFHQYTVRILDGRRDAVREHLQAEGIGSMVYYPVPQDRLPVYADDRRAPCPMSDRLAEEVLSLPIWPTLEDERVERVAEALRAAL